MTHGFSSTCLIGRERPTTYARLLFATNSIWFQKKAHWVSDKPSRDHDDRSEVSQKLFPRSIKGPTGDEQLHIALTLTSNHYHVWT